MTRISSHLRTYWIGILISLTFFIVGMTTLSHYGINIDEPIHFERGNAYLSFFLTGSHKYLDVEFDGPRKSEWKYRGYDAAYFIQNDSGHPPLNGILAAASNRLLYEKLGLMGDLESYHLFELLVSSALVFLMFLMIKNRYGTFAGTISALSLVLYPLFYGESHFNIKDPVEASFFAFTLYFFYLGIERVKAKYFLLSSIFCALAFGTKFNIVFAPFIILPYFLARRGPAFMNENKKLEKLKKVPKSVYISLLAFPVIVIGVHFLSRPFLWSDPINRFFQIVQYYKDIGTGTDYQARFIKKGLNTFPVLFAGMSTPLVILTYFSIGVVAGLTKLRQEKDKFFLLMLLWFGVTIARVSLPGTSIYGGVRQIMEYIPAMAAIAGIGALYLKNFMERFLNKRLAAIIVIASFIPLVVTLIQLHPNENLFMNSLVGGLKGATQKKIPGAGETMGNAYLQGIWWLNEHVEKGARFGFPVGLGSNFPPQFVRKDIVFGGHFSGMKRGGEYMMEMFSVEFPIHRYTYDYLDRFLIPVYVKTVDGVPILKIWKNDITHTKPGFINEIEEKILIQKDSNSLYFNLQKEAYVTRIEVNYDNQNCTNDTSSSFGYVTSSNMETVYPDDTPLNQGRYVSSLQKDNKLVYFFPAINAKQIHISPHAQDSCLLNVSSARVFSLKDTRP